MADTTLLSYNVAKLRQDFPILSRQVNGKPLVYLDNAASAQKPHAVLETMRQLYEEEYANVHRGVHTLSGLATARYEAARKTVQKFLNAASADEIVFTKNATEAINLVAQCYGERFLPGDEIILSQLEHHANIVPWQMLRERKGIVLKIAPITSSGELDLEAFEKLLSPRTKLVAMAHISNALGSVLPIQKIIRFAHAAEAVVLIDGCQAAPHAEIDVQALDADFYVFAGHKVYGPTGVGVLYGKLDLLNSMPPYQGGGDMIEKVTFEKTTFKPAPGRFEAGTPAIAEVIGLAAAIDYITAIGKSSIAAHEQALLKRATELVSDIPGLTLHGTAKEKAAIVSFNLKNAHAQDVGMLLDQQGIAIRTGHHCCMPLMESLGITGTCRASFGLYNTLEEAEALAKAIRKAAEMLS